MNTTIGLSGSKLNEKRIALKAVIDFYLSLATVAHNDVKEHSLRVGKLAARSANTLRMDVRASYAAGVLHDIGKIVQPSSLFDGHNITEEEYGQVKKHAADSFNVLKNKFLFTALVSGLHHALGRNGYGIELKDFPESIAPETAKKILDIASLIAICDFTDAFLTRKTTRKDGGGAVKLEGALEEKFPYCHTLIPVVLGHAEKIYGANLEN